MRVYTKEEVCEYIGSRGALPQDVGMTPEEDFDAWIEHMNAGDYEIGKEISMGMRPVKLVFSEQQHGEQGPDELEVMCNQGVRVEMLSDRGKPDEQLIDIATGDRICHRSGEDWMLNLPMRGGIMPVAFYRQVTVQAVSQ